MDRTDNKIVRQLIYNKYNGKCAYCGCQLNNKFNIDHIIPLKRNMKSIVKGENIISNYNPSCISCNCSKSTYDLETWRNELKLKVKRLNRDSSQYVISKRFGLITENEIDVTFYFEKIIK